MALKNECFPEVNSVFPSQYGWRVSEAYESQTSYSVKQDDIFQYQSYSHSDDMLIILKSNINTNTSIFVFFRGKNNMIQNTLL
jgi:hypothetical protein